MQTFIWRSLIVIVRTYLRLKLINLISNMNVPQSLMRMTIVPHMSSDRELHSIFARSDCRIKLWYKRLLRIRQFEVFLLIHGVLSCQRECISTTATIRMFVLKLNVYRLPIRVSFVNLHIELALMFNCIYSWGQLIVHTLWMEVSRTSKVTFPCLL